MSYAIIKNIKVKDDKVIVAYSDNNVSPKDYTPCELPALTRVLKEKGKEALDIYILEAYEQGNFQRGNNKYTRALKVLLHMPEYKKFNWRNDWDEYKKNKDNDNEGEFKKLLRKALDTRLPKQKYVITKEYHDEIVYFSHRAKSSFCNWYKDKNKAKKFDYEEDAEFTKKWFTGSENWKVLEN